MSEVIRFKKTDVKNYLDACIEYWREQRVLGTQPAAVFYIDAFQSVRISLFGELLPEKEELEHA